jgi:hypothetical protein
MKILERVDIVEKYDHIINNSIGLGSTKTCNNFKGMGSNFRLARKLVYSHKKYSNDEKHVQKEVLEEFI